MGTAGAGVSPAFWDTQKLHSAESRDALKRLLIRNVRREVRASCRSSMLADLHAHTSVEQTDWWLRNNPRDAQHLNVKALRELLAVKPPRGVKIFPPAPPTPAA
jgi:hypothetical protein